MTTALNPSPLAAPPQPPIPALHRPLSPEGLADALRSFSTSYYANHPFHQLMHEGRLTPRQLQGWVANRLAYQRAIPRKDAAIISNCPDPDVRREWMQRIVDHDGSRPGTGRAADRDGGRAACLAWGPIRRRSLRNLLQNETLDRCSGVLANRALCP